MSWTIRWTMLGSAVVACAGLAGCGSSAPPAAVERLPGKWHGEMIVYEDAVQGKLPPEKIAELQELHVLRAGQGGRPGIFDLGLGNRLVGED